MRKPKSISAETKTAILEAAWSLIAETGRTDVAMTEIASSARVSRQAVFYAFGGRSGLLLAMVRHRDEATDHIARLRTKLADPEPTRTTLAEAAAIWLEYLPVIYPVGVLLDAAAITDADAEAAWRDRMIDGLLGGFKRLAARIHARNPLECGPDRTAEEIWAEVHPSAWRRLVVECGWSPEEFVTNRQMMVQRILGLL